MNLRAPRGEVRVRLLDAAGQPMLGFESARIDLEWTSLVRRGLVLSEIRLDAPFVNAVPSAV